MGLPTTATYIVMASLTAPIIVQVGGANNFIVTDVAGAWNEGDKVRMWLIHN